MALVAILASGSDFEDSWNMSHIVMCFKSVEMLTKDKFLWLTLGQYYPRGPLQVEFIRADFTTSGWAKWETGDGTMKQTGGIPPNLVEKCSKIVFPKVGDIVLKDWSVSSDDEEPGWSGECISESAVYVRPSLHFFSCSASRCSPRPPLRGCSR